MFILFGFFIANQIGLAGWWYFGFGLLVHFLVYALVGYNWGWKGIAVLTTIDILTGIVLKSLSD